MFSRLALTKVQFVIAIAYAAAFPLSNLIGGPAQTFFLFATAPFLAIGYIVGSVFVGLLGSTKAYPIGLFVAVLIQTWLLLALWNQRKKAQNDAIG